MSKDTETTPIINFVANHLSFEEGDVLSKQIMRMHMAHHEAGLNAVEWMKAKLGRQSYTWTGEFRFWVWERDDWRVYVSNQKGIGFEVKADLSPTEAFVQWGKYLSALGLG